MFNVIVISVFAIGIMLGLTIVSVYGAKQEGAQTETEVEYRYRQMMETNKEMLQNQLMH